MRAAFAVQGIGFLIIVGALIYIAGHGSSSDDFADVEQASLPMNTTMTEPTEHLLIRSPAFVHEEVIPSKYTCDGENTSPPLALDNIPEGTVSLALIVDDPDAPSGTWDHWLVFNMSPDTERVGEGEEPRGTAGLNSWGKTGYGGPCPPNGEHRYLFKVYALDTALTLEAGASKAMIEQAMDGHIIERATLMGRYTRQDTGDVNPFSR